MAEALAQPYRASAWSRHAVACGVVLLALLVGFGATFGDMVRVWWTSSTFNHGFLILPIALFIGAQKRATLASMTPSISAWGVAYAIFNGLLWVAGELMSVAFFQHAAVVGMVIGSGWALLGNAVFRVLLFPFLYLYFAVPEGEFLVPYLQDLTAAVLVEALRLTGIPVFIEGRYLAIPSGNFVVAEACSGINYLIATLAVGTMFMYLNFVSWRRRAAFMACAIAVPLLANGLRAYGIVMIAHLSDYRLAMGVDHFIYGWVFFGLVIFALFALGNLFSDVGRRQPRPPPAGAPSTSPRRTAATTAALLAALFVPRGLLALSDSARPAGPPIALPAVQGWAGPEAVPTELGAEFDGADRYTAGSYRGPDGERVVLELIYLRDNGIDGELVNQKNVLFDEQRWQQLDYGLRKLPSPSIVGRVYAMVLRDRKTGEEWQVWHWYDANGTRSATRFDMKLAEALGRLAGRHTGGASVTVRAPRDSRHDPGAVLAAFTRAESLKLEAMLVPPDVAAVQ